MSLIRHAVKREMKKAGLDARSERLICTGLVISDRVCRELYQVPDVVDLFVADFTQWVVRTCLDYWHKHKSAPGRHIEDAFHLAKRNNKLKPDTASLVSDFLGSISTEFERSDHFNEGYVVEEVALPYLRTRSLRTTSNDVNALLDAGRLEEAEQCWGEFRKTETVIHTGHDLFEDKELLKRAFQQQEHPLFTVPGAVGALLAPQLVRTNFVSTIGVVGRGKSFWLQELGKYAARGRCNVMMIGVGDMSAEDYALRMACSLTGRSNRPRDCEPGWVPCVDCVKNQNGTCDLALRKGSVSLPDEIWEEEVPNPDMSPKGYIPCDRCMHARDFEGAPWWRMREATSPLTVQEGWKAVQRFDRRLKGRHFRLCVYPSKGVTPDKTEMELERLRDVEGWLPDVIIIDYMDEYGSDMQSGEQFRHREADKWSRTRGIMMRWNALGLVAEQSDAAGYDRDTLSLKNFNEDRRRNDVVTGKLGYNRTVTDEERGIARLSWAGKLRNASFGINDQVVIAQDLSCARPLLGSWWKRGPRSC